MTKDEHIKLLTMAAATLLSGDENGFNSPRQIVELAVITASIIVEEAIVDAEHSPLE